MPYDPFEPKEQIVNTVTVKEVKEIAKEITKDALVEYGASDKLENIVDKDGHKRFIEGTLNVSSGIRTKVIIDYNRWSLSGTHLMIVLAFTPTEDITITDTNILSVSLENWIIGKIKTLGGGESGNIGFSSVLGVATNADPELKPVYLYSRKDNNSLSVGSYYTNSSPFNVNYTDKFLTGKHYRIQFDYIIDNA